MTYSSTLPVRAREVKVATPPIASTVKVPCSPENAIDSGATPSARTREAETSELAASVVVTKLPS